MSETPVILRYDYNSLVSSLEQKVFGESREVYRQAGLVNGSYTPAGLLSCIEKVCLGYDVNHPYHQELRCLRIMVKDRSVIEVKVPWDNV